MSINITISSASAVGGASVAASSARASESVTVAATASTATAAAGEIWTVTAEVDVFVQFGAAPTGVAPRWRLKAGETRNFCASTSGEKIAFATV